MGKVKIKRKSTLIDMTAMSDVTVLLLTFFMLTSTFVKKEAVQVTTPSSVQEVPVPVSNYATILVSPDGDVSLSVIGDSPEASVDYAKEQYKAANDGKDMPSAESMKLRGKWMDDSVRISVIKEAVGRYEQQHGQKLGLTEKEVRAIASYGVFGVPFKDLKRFANLSSGDMDKLFSDYASMNKVEKIKYNRNPKNIGVGLLPTGPDDREVAARENRDLNHANDFQIWMQALKVAAQDNYPVLNNAITTGEGLIVKADRKSPYDIMHPVLDNLQTLKMTRFTLQTALKNSKK